ncbi:GNAT family N-acetyltransferase [Janthinobacterium sp.]|uniref:GNAT family N-acetyltransferase n=1 Tax=Janthinobacterium sp. TaxID=1871054 RepID=UPI00293D5294|nr:GNAT family N-acetyltransferase [Janthinobacterium sp.]
MNPHSENVLQPTLDGALLTLRPLAAEDFEALFEVAGDPLLWAQHPQPTRHQRDVFKVFFDAALASGGALVAVHKASRRLVACSRYYNWLPDEGSVCIGYTFVGREYWGTGINRELKTLMLAHAFEWVATVLFEVGPENHRSRRALEKIGAVFSHSIAPGAAPRPGLVYAIDAAAAALSALSPR